MKVHLYIRWWKDKESVLPSLFSNNKLIIMDEPFSSIDKQNSDEIFQNILRECKDKTLILSNHKIINKNYFNKVLYFQKR